MMWIYGETGDEIAVKKIFILISISMSKKEPE